MKMLCIAGLMLFAPCAIHAAAQELTYEEYEAQLTNAEQREKAAKEQVATEQAGIEELKQKILTVDERITAVSQERYAVLGVSEYQVGEVESEIAALRREIEFLLGLSPEEQAARISDIKKAEARFAELAQKSSANLWAIKEQLAELNDMISRIQPAMPTSPMNYTVQYNPAHRDCLFRIAANEDVYGDPAKWPLLYRANKSQIDAGFVQYKKQTEAPKYSRAADLIYPGQVLEIPR